MTRLTVSRRTLLVSSLAAAATRPAGALAQDNSVPIKIGIGSDPIYSAFFLAAHEKMFADQKLNVALQVYTDGGEAMNGLVAQQVDLATAAEPSHFVRFGRAELRPLALVCESGRYIKMVIGKGVASPEKAKKFGIVPGTVSEYSTLLALKKLGVDPASVQFVRSGPPELPALLARGDIDAFFAWEPWPSGGVRQGGRVVMTSADLAYSGAIWLTAGAGWLAGNAGAAQGILKAIAQACDIVIKDPQRAATAVQAVTKIPVAQTLMALKDMDPGVRDFTDADFKSYDSIADFLQQQKMTPGLVDFRRFLQRGFYRADRT